MVSNEEINKKLRQKRASINNNGYLICDTCQEYYELEPGESPEDFSSKCECNGNYKYVKNLNNQLEENEEEIEYSMWTGNPKGVKKVQQSAETSINEGEIKYSMWTGKPIGIVPVESKKNVQKTKSTKNECTNCKKINPDGAEFCINCGQDLKINATNLCSNCKTENPPEAHFCLKCGENLSNSTQNNQLNTNDEYLKILKQQEQHSKDIKVVVLFLFAMVIIVLPIIALWYYFNP